MKQERLRCFVFAATAACLLFSLSSLGHAADTKTDATTTHHIQNVFIILMENHTWTGGGNLDIKGNPAAPYINKTLIPMSSYAQNYSNPPNNHPSLPNYLWLEGGTNFGITDDGDPISHHIPSSKHLVALLENAGISWKSYQESMPANQCPLATAGEYVAKHNPFVCFDDVTDNLNPQSANCISHIRPFGELIKDLSSGNTARYNFITPNVCDDMHDNCGGDSIAHGDKWLSQHIPAILNSYAYQNGGVIFIVWDEAEVGDGQVPFIMLSPFAKGHGYSNENLYTMVRPCVHFRKSST